jgi:DNA (cytosine-5)-methyltransferase 1
MARAGLGPGWDCVLANDIDPAKCAAYRENWGGADLIEGDVAALDASALERGVDLCWASSPCQDFSLAGRGAGLAGARSGAFGPWMRLVEAAARRGRGPRIIAFENVTGLMARRGGADFAAVVGAFAGLGYRVGALTIDARDFLPQSRPRLFVVAVRGDMTLPSDLTRAGPGGPFHGPRLTAFVRTLPDATARAWVWWALPAPPPRDVALADVIERDAAGGWLDRARLDRLLSLMSGPSLARLAELRARPGLSVATVYKRGRPDGTGAIRQRAELRADGLAGCLRTPAGGSSRQTLLIAEDGALRARLMTAREAARLMGLPDDYRLPARYNDAYRLAGDGVAVPVVRRLRDGLFAPLLSGAASTRVA